MIEPMKELHSLLASFAFFLTAGLRKSWSGPISPSSSPMTSGMPISVDACVQLLAGFLFLAAGTQAPASDGPVAWWKFDAWTALESVSGTTNELEGNYKFMPEGVRGGCLRFDGFTTLLRCKAAQVPALSKGLTLQAWVAMAAYSWNWTPLIAQRDGETRGYSFGIDSRGHFGLQLAADYRWTTCLATNVLKLKTWHHVTAVYDPAFGVHLFLDGQPAGSFPVEKGLTLAKDIDLFIGRNHDKMVPAHLVRDWAKFPSWWSLDGLLDEVKIHDRPLTAPEIQSSWAAEKPTTARQVKESVVKDTQCRVSHAKTDETLTTMLCSKNPG